MTVKNKDIETRMIRSRIQLLMKFPFYGTLALSLNLKEDYSVSTAGVDGTNFYYNPDFIETLNEGELNWITVHEVMHCALGHIWRRGSRVHQKFNIACDYAIHSILKESEDSKDLIMPKGCLYDSKFNNKSAEEIYDMLPDMPNMPNMGQGSGQGSSDDEDNQNGNNNGNNNGWGTTLDDHSKWGNSDVQENGKIKQQEWLEKMISASEVAEAKKPGSTPGSLKRLIGKLKKPQKNWRELLAEFIQFEVFDYGFLPPDRRYYGFSDLLMPDYNEETEKVQDLVFVIDTSGSIGDKELVTFFSELVGMMQQFTAGVKGHIIFADSEVASVYDFETVDDILKVKPAGGGGTDFVPAIKYAMDKRESGEWEVVGLVYLTDLYGSHSNDEVNKDTIPFDVLWISTTEVDSIPQTYYPDYGRVTYLEIK